MGAGGLDAEPQTNALSEPRGAPVTTSAEGQAGMMPDTTAKEPQSSIPKNTNSLYLSAVAIVAIIAVTIISMNDSGNSSAVIGLMNLATGAVGGMAGVALQKRQD